VVGLNEEEFQLLCRLSGWALCNIETQEIIKKSELKSSECNKDLNSKNSTGKVPQTIEEKKKFGWYCKRLLDWGRLLYCREVLGFSKTKLVYYIDVKFTLENVMLLATR